MQMYKVEFHSQRGPLVETGKLLVCAGNAEQAEGMVAGFLNIAPSSARFTVTRVKPSIYELARSEFKMTDAIPVLGGGGDEPGRVHEIRASAKVFSYSESAAVRRFANALIESASANKQSLSKHVNDLSLEIEHADERPRPSRIEEQSIYKEKRFFAGGAGRPR